MSKDDKKLLKNRKVVEEINRHLWIESEKAGYDIGFEKASIDWLERFSTAWMSYHMPEKKSKEQSTMSYSSYSHSKNTSSKYKSQQNTSR